jgi:hypothetical protein
MSDGESKAIVKYGSYEMEEAEHEAQDLEKLGSGSFMKLVVGKNQFRVLPPPLGKKSPFVVIWTHFIDAKGGERLAFVCPRLEVKKPCPICTTAERLKSNGNPADFEKAKGMFARRQVHCNVINRSEPERGPVILRFSKGVHEDLVALRKNEDVGGDFTHPEHGFDIIIERKGTGKNDTKYKVYRHKNETPLGNMEWLEMQHDLEKLRVILTPDQMREKAAGGKEGDGAKTVSAEHAPVSRRSTVEQDAIEDAVVEGDDGFLG